MNESTILLGVMAAVFVGLVAIWRELRVLGRAARAKISTERVVLPMSTGGRPVLPTQQVQITGRPQGLFRPERLFISDGFGGAADWIVNDIKIGNKSIFLHSGDIPGDMFSSKAVDTMLSFPICDLSQDVVVVATYVGKEEKGAPLSASMTGVHIPQKRSRAERRRKAALMDAAIN